MLPFADAASYPDLLLIRSCKIVRTALRLALVVIIAFPLLLSGCTDKSSGSGGSGNFVPRYLVESEPTRTLDGRYVYFIATDTINLGKSGIFRAEVSKPIRGMVLAGEDLHSPTLAPNNSTLAYLNGGRIEYYNQFAQTIDTSSIGREFRSIAYLNDSLLVACGYPHIYIVNELRETATLVWGGWDPSAVSRDTFIYVVFGPGEGYSVVTCDISQSRCDTIFFVSTLDNVGIVRWPSLESQMGRLAWGRDNINGMRVYVGGIEPYFVRMLHSTERIKPLLLGPDKLIFTSSDGRFWESDWAGSDPFPWWYRVPND